MPFNNFLNSNNPLFRLNEGNFISDDILGLVDSDARFKLSELTLDKLFEGLDLEKSQSLCNLIGNNSLSIKDSLDLGKFSRTTALQLLLDQIEYMQIEINEIEREFDKWYDYVIRAHKQKEGKEKEALLAKYTSPESISSVIPRIEKVVQDAKNSGIDFSDERVRESFNALHKISISSILQILTQDIEQSAKNVGLKSLYREIDSYSMDTIESDSASTIVQTYITKQLDYKDMYESNDPLSRLAAFFEQALMLYPFGYYMKRNFQENYDVITDSPLAISTLKQFVPKIDFMAFDDMSGLLDSVAEILVTRIYANNPEEINKNIFVPAFQATWVAMLTLVSMKLINYNVEIADVIVQKEIEKKQEIARTYAERSKKVFDSYKNLSDRGFFSSDTSIYREGSRTMDAQNIMYINNMLHSLKLVPDSKLDSMVYDAETRDGIMKFQSINRARLVDGIIGSETRRIIEKTAKAIADKYKLS